MNWTIVIDVFNRSEKGGYKYKTAIEEQGLDFYKGLSEIEVITFKWQKEEWVNEKMILYLSDRWQASSIRDSRTTAEKITIIHI